MKFELFAAPKKADVSNSEIPKLLSELNLKEHEDVVWSFLSEDNFSNLFNLINSKIGSKYDFGLIALDGSEYQLVPDKVETNEDYLHFCVQRSRNEPSNDLLPIRVHFERYLEKVELQFRVSEDSD